MLRGIICLSFRLKGTSILLSLRNFIFLKERGATAIEYALIAGSIATVIVAVLGLLGGTVQGRYQAVLDIFK